MGAVRIAIAIPRRMAEAMASPTALVPPEMLCRGLSSIGLIMTTDPRNRMNPNPMISSIMSSEYLEKRHPSYAMKKTKGWATNSFKIITFLKIGSFLPKRIWALSHTGTANMARMPNIKWTKNGSMFAGKICSQKTINPARYPKSSGSRQLSTDRA